LLRRKATKWAWLSGARESGNAVPRSVLVVHAQHDHGELLEFVSEACRNAVANSTLHPALLNLWLSLSVDLIAAQSLETLSTQTVPKLLPYIVGSMRKHPQNHEYQVAALLIMSALGQRVQFARQVFHSFFAAFAKLFAGGSSPPQLYDASLLCLVSLAQSQQTPLALPTQMQEFLLSYPYAAPGRV
jgi:hypothetical protein